MAGASNGNDAATGATGRCCATVAAIGAVSVPGPEQDEHERPDAGLDARPDNAAETPPPPAKLVRAPDGRFRFATGSRLENNLSWIVGCLELANAGDFAANVWNDVPVPVYAIVFMALGGTVAGVMCVFAFRDARLAWRNMGFLRRQRRRLRAAAGLTPLDRAVLLAVAFREYWSEVINRWVMDLLMGCGAVLISVGTYMAIGGEDPDVWLASNILSGYLGNTPIALFGIVNSCWALYMWAKAQSHVVATRRALGRGSRAAALVKRRSRNVQVFYTINGTAAILGGAGSMLTATRWWGYVILIPVIISSIFCNWWWRRRVGYVRAEPRPADAAPLAPADLVLSLEFAARAEILIREQQTGPGPGPGPGPIGLFVTDPTSLPDVLAFLSRHALLDDVCLRAVSNPELCDALGGAQATELLVGKAELLALPASLRPLLLETAQECVRDLGPQHFRNRERHAAELLGAYCSMAGHADFDDGEKVLVS